MKIAYWVFCASKHNRKFQILTFGEIHTIRFSNFNRIRIRILFGFGKSGEYEYEYIRFWKIIRIRIRILFGLKISAEYEYEYHYSVSTIRILFEYRIIRSPLIQSYLLLLSQHFRWSSIFHNQFNRDISDPRNTSRLRYDFVKTSYLD